MPDPIHHEFARYWEDLPGGDEPVGLATIVLVGFVRIATNPATFKEPYLPEDAGGPSGHGSGVRW